MTLKSCLIPHLAPQKIRALQKNLLSPGTLQELAETFKVLGDPTRLNIITLLVKREFCVCDIASILGATNSLISHQLRVLRNLRLVKVRREGQNAFYSLDDDHIRHLFNEGLIHVRERE
jgi:ArsR family transcriptional regulator, lead/cadmium/zinc/bismuth-responsive transcriptional repressor